ncbi:MAG TPA: ABC-2 family transporter protein [Candidatus Rifleibacterium sp.]|nr:ABC-2 family transporter protein [Candidatus Rifleibacterium sp.]
MISNRISQSLNAHLATLRAHFKIIFTYRGMMLIQAVRLILLPLVLAAAWLSIQKTAENPYSDADYLLYYLLVPVILNLTDSRLVFRFPMAVRDGSLSRELLKPFPPLSGYALESIANNLIQLIYLLPFTLLAGYAISDRLQLGHLNLQLLLYTLLAILLGGLVRMLISGSISLVGFWLEDVTTLNLILNGGIWALLGGMIVPVATFPQHIRCIAEMLPYRYMLSFPIEIVTGRLSQAQILQGFAVCLFWSLLFALIMRFIWKRGLKVYAAYGG